MAFLFFIIPVALSCNMYQTNNPNFYCDNIIAWPVSADVQASAWQRSKSAYSLYFDLKTRYLENVNTGSNNNSAPTLDCLAIAQEFYCAYSYPYCKDDINEPERGVCSFFCDLWTKRCPNEPYDVFCQNKQSTFCSFSLLLFLSSYIFII